MFLEFCNYSRPYFDSLEKQIEDVFDAISLGFPGIAVPIYLLRELHEYIKDIPVEISTCIDFPNGTSDKKLRMHECAIAGKAGANSVDLCLNPFWLKERAYHKILEEFNTHTRICNDYNMTLRPIIHYNLYSYRETLAIAKLMQDAGCQYIIPASGFHNDDVYDNVVVCKAIERNTNIKAVCNGYIWLEKQFNDVVNMEIYGLRLYSIKLLSSFPSFSV